ncbi:MAG: type IV pilus modification protein PilV [Verminephrobacter sp.]|nr:type IV pilus modification protein PilV [Verminephrobacter sp.]
MSQLVPSLPIAHRLQRGISLIESLVAIVVMALGILGILGVQMRTLADTSTSVRRAQAIRLIEDLGERMKTNPSALANLNTYVSNFAANPSVGSCASGCDQAQLAAYDLAVWKRTVRENLPLGKASIFLPPAESALPAGQGRQLGVMIAWRENERDNSTGTAGYKDDIDATKVRAADGSLSAGGGTDTATNACPVDHTCHLQYIPVPSRCAPYAPGTGVPFYYCPGS